MYLGTVSPATSQPRNQCSAWIRRRPQVGFSRAMRRISARISRSIGGRPAERCRDFQRHIEVEALAVPSEDGRGLDNDEALGERLEEITSRVREHGAINVEPMQLAALLLRRQLGNSDAEAEKLVRPRRRASR
jgi:hypothetical protein